MYFNVEESRFVVLFEKRKQLADFVSLLSCFEHNSNYSLGLVFPVNPSAANKYDQIVSELDVLSTTLKLRSLVDNHSKYGITGFTLRSGESELNFDVLKQILHTLKLSDFSAVEVYGEEDKYFFDGNKFVAGGTRLFNSSYDLKSKVKNCLLMPGIKNAYIGSEHSTYTDEYMFEYFSTPYYFCFELLADRGFLTELSGELAKIKKVLPELELLELIKKSTSDYLELSGGIGIFRGINEEHIPRYFIRKELRKRGITLPEGDAEKYAKQLGLE